MANIPIAGATVILNLMKLRIDTLQQKLKHCERTERSNQLLFNDTNLELENCQNDIKLLKDKEEKFLQQVKQERAKYEREINEKNSQINELESRLKNEVKKAKDEITAIGLELKKEKDHHLATCRSPLESQESFCLITEAAKYDGPPELFQLFAKTLIFGKPDKPLSMEEFLNIPHEIPQSTLSKEKIIELQKEVDDLIEEVQTLQIRLREEKKKRIEMKEPSKKSQKTINFLKEAVENYKVRN